VGVRLQPGLRVPEEVSKELAADAAAFASALPASIEMPAGAGKTHLLSATARHIVRSGGRVLVLTHTNAGVYAIKARLKRFGVTQGVQVSTITSFAFRLTRAYPMLAQLQVPTVMVPADSTAYVKGATRVASSQHIKAVLASSFTHMLVDEYQDCNEPHHAFVSAIGAAVPATGVLGDPLQAIFGFNERLADWAAVTAEYPPHPATITPHRWSGHNKALGTWLLRIRPLMRPGHVVHWENISLPDGVTFQNIAADRQGLARAAFAYYPADETVLIIAAWPSTARAIAGDLNGAFTVMEEVAGKFMVEALGRLVATDPSAYALWLYNLTKSCHCGHAVLDTGTLRNRYAVGRTASDLLEGGSGSRAGAEIAIHAFDMVVSQPTLSNLVAAMDIIPGSSALRLHSHEAWYDVQTAIRGAVAQGNDTTVLLEELAKAREVLRYAGRRERNRVISRTLLVKGLECDHVIIADVNDHARVNDLYVALSRARKSIRILGSSSSLRLQPSPNGR
jgi:hypothetical protein